jgi:uncharacterized membrane protein YkvA (DUF1232 family)
MGFLNQEGIMAKISEKQAREQFEKYSRNVTENDVFGVLKKEKSILSKVTGPLKEFGQNISLLFSLIKNYKAGTYKEIPWTTITAVVGSLIYVFSPIDLIPDFIPFAGLLDDAAVLGFCLAAIKNDLDKYKSWKGPVDVEYEVIKDDAKPIEKQ